MPDLATLLNTTFPALPHSSNLKHPPSVSPDPTPTDPIPTLPLPSFADPFRDDTTCDADGFRVPKDPRRAAADRTRKAPANKSLGDHVKAWAEKKVDSGASPLRCFLPFLVNAPRMMECLVCRSFVHPGEEIMCSVRRCQLVYHLDCAKEKLGFSLSRKFKCPKHVCFLCKQKPNWHCVRCSIASHDKCAAWPDKVITLGRQTGKAICWRHPVDWRLETKHAVPVSDIEEVFCHLPLPYGEEEFKIDLSWKGVVQNELEPPSYVHIRRNVYLVKKKRDDADDGIGCTNCNSSACYANCVCRVQSISCSKACHCSEMCANRPFRKEKKIKIVKTESCGWGVEAAELINGGDFIVEYIGEVIDDALCEQRLWDLKYKGVQNFYMCEIRKDFTIDATYKGNLSRFLNHSCDPNCKLEKWQVDGETRVGVFAARSITVGEPLTYDYRFVQFGPEVKCYCGASNCQGYLGTKRKICKITFSWGLKRRRTSTPTACLAFVTV